MPVRLDEREGPQECEQVLPGSLGTYIQHVACRAIRTTLFLAGLEYLVIDPIMNHRYLLFWYIEVVHEVSFCCLGDSDEMRRLPDSASVEGQPEGAP